MQNLLELKFDLFLSYLSVELLFAMFIFTSGLTMCSLLASGSDDVQVIIWDPFRKKQLTTIRTGHNGNIFSVKVRPLTLLTMILS